MIDKPEAPAGLARFVETLAAVPPTALEEPARWRVIATPARGRHSGLPRTQRIRWSAGAALGIAGCIAAVVVVVLLVSGGSPTVEQASALPVFKRPAHDASQIRSLTPVMARSAAEYDAARKVATPNGVGYVMPAGGGRVCLAVPDPSSGGFGEACATEQESEQRGLHVAIISAKRGVMVAVVPTSVTEATLTLAQGETKSLPVVDGVISASASSGQASVSYSVGEHRVRVPLHNPANSCILAGQGISEQELEQAAAHHGIKVCSTPLPSRHKAP